jgi:HD-GYP domain-containing protein (c-di-GMP phosphodiesterase class II)
MNEKFSDFLFCMVTAMAQCSLYSKDHPAVTEYSGKALEFLSELFINDSIDITHLGGKLILNNTPLLEKGTYMENFVRRMKTKGIDKIIFKRGISTEELMSFIYLMASKTEPLVSTDHIIVGTVQVRVKQTEEDPSAIMRASISRVKDVYQEFSRSKRLDVAGLEDAVLGFLLALKKEANVLRLVSPIKSHSEYTYVHAANVAVLTLFQTQYLGLKDEGLRETGYAGLLHDMGKLFVSKEIIDKQAKLNETEWKEMKRHPIYGSIYLGSLSDIPRLAVVAAYEHHLKFDGSGYPDTKWRARKQHIISQIVALADFFDALRAERPYRKGVELHALIDLIKGGSGKDFNPQLVDSFINAMKKAGALSFS